MAGLDSDALEMILDSLREYAAQKLPLSYLLELDKDEVFPGDIIKEMYDPEQLGLHLLLIPEEYGGLGGNAYDVYRVCEQLARIDLGIATSIFATFLGLDPLRIGGTHEQKQRWMTQVAEQGLLVAYGATEAQAGSDLGALRTHAEPVQQGDDVVGYRLNGEKQWISNAGYAALFLVLARTSKGTSWFVVERDTPGLEPGRAEEKHGIRLSNTAPFALNDVYVDADHLVGVEEGQGLVQAQAVFGYTRLMVAAFGLGAGWEATERAIRYGQQRIQAGSPLFDKQGYTHKLLVPYAVALEAARAYIEQTAARLDGGEEGLQTEGAIAKYFATNTGNAAAEAAIQALGGYGYTREFAVEKIKRDVRITCIYEGTSEILEMTIARDRWQQHIKSKGQLYADLAASMQALHEENSAVGADAAALALAALGAVFANCRAQRLTRNQHVLLRLGELVSHAEVAMAFCKRAARAERSPAIPLQPETLQAMARIQARKAALKVATEGVHLVSGAGTGDCAALMNETRMVDILDAQRGLLADMDSVASQLRDAFPAQ